MLVLAILNGLTLVFYMSLKYYLVAGWKQKKVQISSSLRTSIFVINKFKYSIKIKGGKSHLEAFYGAPVPRFHGFSKGNFWLGNEEY